jgi:16S rRNA (uracil1498-N3)-methyltransferase
VLSLFFSDQISTEQRQVLQKDEAHHAIKVLRVKLGEIIKISDGIRNWVSGPVDEITKKELFISITERGEIKIPKPELVLVQAITKSDRHKEMLELAVEAGVDQIIPWQAERSISKWKLDSLQKWQAGILQSCKQARQIKLPQLSDVMETSAVVKMISSGGFGVVFHEAAPTKLSEIEIPTTQAKIYLVIGPEGGISDQELELFNNAQIRVVRLAETVFRSAHAGFAALSAVQTKLGRW